MKKVVIVYWSGSGNTKMMAEAIEAGAKEAGADVSLLEVSEASVADVEAADVAVLGCPSMGAEVLEEDVMEPFVESLNGKVNGKEMALFGSYGWGNGEWMEDWAERMESYGANLVAESLIINETPDDDGLAQCQDLGKAVSA